MMKALMTVVALSVVSAGAAAHEGMHGPGAKYDADKSGALSLKEYTAYLAGTGKDASGAEAQFAALDADKDGVVSSGEFLRGHRDDPK